MAMKNEYDTKNFNEAAYNQILEELIKTRDLYKNKCAKTKKDKEKAKEYLKNLKKYIQKEMKKCDCDYKKSKAIVELERMNDFLQ
jgi:intergrase/recombinase